MGQGLGILLFAAVFWLISAYMAKQLPTIRHALRWSGGVGATVLAIAGLTILVRSALG